jgi:hypothetical protein
VKDEVQIFYTWNICGVNGWFQLKSYEKLGEKLVHTKFRAPRLLYKCRNSFMLEDLVMDLT